MDWVLRIDIERGEGCKWCDCRSCYDLDAIGNYGEKLRRRQPTAGAERARYVGDLAAGLWFFKKRSRSKVFKSQEFANRVMQKNELRIE
ncbi:hypothetical protein GCM10011400_64890 [Paraburkholderia caffeinilytica]|uniref:Uncharacterized protein n=1 Tax=Paraburkholderia caffeinilytica TaxID=1761016 RepID=A0ABQ1NBV1_9BURK|nr:hypothetical protein GCM10011400_64890 [Paraburkholderia caffeinilytica]